MLRILLYNCGTQAKSEVHRLQLCSPDFLHPTAPSESVDEEQFSWRYPWSFFVLLCSPGCKYLRRAPPILYWNVLRWNFEVERVDVRLGHNLEYRVECQGCPFWCPSAQKKATWRGGGGHTKQDWHLAFQGGKSGWNWLKFCGGIWTPWLTISTGIHSPGPPVSRASMRKPRVQVERLLGSVKQQNESWERDRVTLWQLNETHQWQLGNLEQDLVNCYPDRFAARKCH